MSTVRKRSRLTTEQRRAQLLDVGAEVFGTRPFDEVSLENIAEQAGVSPALLYHYFGTKRKFMAAVVEVQSALFLETTRPDAALPVEQQLLVGLDCYLQFVEANEYGYRALNSPTLLADGDIQLLTKAGTREQELRIASALGYTEAVPAELTRAIHGWIALTIAVCLRWLDERDCTREQLRDFCAQALFGMLSTINIPGMVVPAT